MNAPPPPDTLAKVLETCSQLWIISSSYQMLTGEHIEVIKITNKNIDIINDDYFYC